jgi:uncharacterized membrane protein YdjX (TVP38/TMEM64 family)
MTTGALWRMIGSVIWLVACLALLLWLFSKGGQRTGDIAQAHPLAGLLLGYGLVAISQIAAPLSGFPIVVGMAKIYGLPLAMGVLYLTYLTTFAVNFWLARSFGRPLVGALLGKARIEKFKAFTTEPDIRYVGLSRVFGYYYNDAISYVWGVSNIGFRRYYLGSIAATVPPAALEYAIVSRISLENPKGLLLFYLALFALSGVLLAGWAVIRRFRSPPRA